MIDKALRRKYFHLLFLIRFFLRYIYRQIIYEKCLNATRVDRHQLVFDSDFQTLQKSTGRVLSINSFFLTNLYRTEQQLIIGISIHDNDFEQFDSLFHWVIY